MSVLNNIRLGLIHVAITITSLAITGVLNRIMINDLDILATIVVVLVILPYVFSPVQIWIGQFSDVNPIMGYRRTPYIVVGVAMALIGMVITPHAALLIASDFWVGIALGFLAFGLWGMGFNIGVVSYLSLASDLSEEDQRSRAIAIMWFMMIISIIIGAIAMGEALDPYSTEQLFVVFRVTALIAGGLALVGIVGLEPRYDVDKRKVDDRHSQREILTAMKANPQARLFFLYLVLMLASILGQDVLLEPFAAFAFDMDVSETTRLTSLWGGMTLVSLILYGFVLDRVMSKKDGAFLGALIGVGALLAIALSGIGNFAYLFLPAVALLGFATGIATASNLGLMLDMTTAAQVGLFIGAWGVADASARGLGLLLSGTVRDIVTFGVGSETFGYVSVFVIQAVMLVVSMVLLARIDVTEFHDNQTSLVELAALQIMD